VDAVECIVWAPDSSLVLVTVPKRASAQARALFLLGWCVLLSFTKAWLIDYIFRWTLIL
jgi:hypothetical protein